MEASRLIEEQVSRCQLESDRPCIGHLRLMSGLSYDRVTRQPKKKYERISEKSYLKYESGGIWGKEAM